MECTSQRCATSNLTAMSAKALEISNDHEYAAIQMTMRRRKTMKMLLGRRLWLYQAFLPLLLSYCF